MSTKLSHDPKDMKLPTLADVSDWLETALAVPISGDYNTQALHRRYVHALCCLGTTYLPEVTRWSSQPREWCERFSSLRIAAVMWLRIN